MEWCRRRRGRHGLGTTGSGIGVGDAIFMMTAPPVTLRLTGAMLIGGDKPPRRDASQIGRRTTVRRPLGTEHHTTSCQSVAAWRDSPSGILTVSRAERLLQL